MSCDCNEAPAEIVKAAEAFEMIRDRAMHLLGVVANDARHKMPLPRWLWETYMRTLDVFEAEFNRPHTKELVAAMAAGLLSTCAHGQVSRRVLPAIGTATYVVCLLRETLRTYPNIVDDTPPGAES
jgi:hypothetical protein